jgi:hypothetical protein
MSESAGWPPESGSPADLAEAVRRRLLDRGFKLVAVVPHGPSVRVELPGGETRSDDAVAAAIDPISVDIVRYSGDFAVVSGPDDDGSRNGVGASEHCGVCGDVDPVRVVHLDQAATFGGMVVASTWSLCATCAGLAAGHDFSALAVRMPESAARQIGMDPRAWPEWLAAQIIAAMP